MQIQASSSLRLTQKKPLITIINRCSLWRVQDFNLRKQTNSKLLEIVADEGHLVTDKETLELIGNVDAQWNTAEGSNQLTAGKITYLITSDTAQAEDGFQLRTPQAQLAGKTLSTDLQNGTTTITSKVRAIYEPH